MHSDPPVLERRRSQAERRSEAEAAILKAAVRIVAERGLERLTLADVGEAAGYSRGLPAHYFGSKDGLTGAIAVHIVRNFGRGVVRADKHTPSFERLLAMMTLYFDGARKDPLTTRALYAVLGEAITNAALRETIADLNARSATAIEDSIRAGMAAGEIRSDVNAHVTAILILSAIRGAVAQWLTDERGIDLNMLRDEFLDGLKRRLGA